MEKWKKIYLIKNPKFFFRYGYAGDLCEHKCSLRCQNGGHCRRSPDRGEWCQCPPQFGGPLCADRQQSDCRQQGGQCPFNQVCLEDPMEAGVARCEWDLCSRWGNPCSNNATCRPVKVIFLNLFNIKIILIIKKNVFLDFLLNFIYFFDF